MLEVLPPWDKNLMGKMIELENSVDQRGYLRLSHLYPVTRLLGNVISPENAAEAKRLGLSAQAVSIYFNRTLRVVRCMRIPAFIRRLTLGLYNRLHILINS